MESRYSLFWVHLFLVQTQTYPETYPFSSALCYKSGYHWEKLLSFKAFPQSYGDVS